MSDDRQISMESHHNLPQINCHGNVPWDIEKKTSDLSSTPKTISYGLKIA